MFAEPLPDGEVMSTTQSIWKMHCGGRNRFGQHGAWFPIQEVEALIRGDQDAFVLLGFLRAYNGPDACFMVANGLADTLGWTRKRLAKARGRLIELEHIAKINERSPSPGNPGRYRWPRDWRGSFGSPP
jgi:hypothetical protein